MVYSIRFEGAERCRLPRCDGSCGEEAGIDVQAPRSSHFLAYVDVNGLGDKQEPLVIDVGTRSYQRPICEQCQRERCWLPEEEALVEHKMDYPNCTIYSHYCLCECHENNLSEGEHWTDDEWDEDEDY